MASLDGSRTTTQTVKSSTTPPPAKTNPNSVSKVRVVVRVRPFLPHEVTANKEYPTPVVSVLQQECQPADEVAVYLKDKETRSCSVLWVLSV